DMHRLMRELSGGWRMRAELARLLLLRPDLLLLDEPTNHLDLATREALSMALNEFEGTVMLVSHDRALLRAVCDEFWMVGRGKVEPFDGDLDDYQRYLLEESKRLREEARNKPAVSASTDADTPAVTEVPVVEASRPAPTATPGLSSAEQRKLDAQRRQQLAAQTRPLRKELENIEQRMPVLEAEKTGLEDRLSTALPATEIAEAGRRLKALSEELSQLEERWLELSEALQQTQ
ncbi:MAG: ATP-binding cassette domain-containing protein, partial [Limnohabitans sp.]